MRKAKLETMKRGWFVGNFEPSLYKTNDVEVGVKTYCSGDYEERHFHRIATEITVIILGEVQMNGNKYRAGDIVVVEPGDITDFLAITDCTNVVVKIPGVNDDKYMEGETRC